MHRFFAVALCGMILGVAGFASAADKDDNATKIAGKWEIVKSGSDLAKGSTVEFTKDGQLTATIKGGEDTKIEGTYKVDKDKLLVKLKAGDQTHEETVTISKLSDTELILKDKDNKVDELKKAK
jgi:uncharacterized protein (TIGR03066 family)